MTNRHQPRRTIRVDFLYLDLTACDRCLGTDSSLDRVVGLVEPVLKEVGMWLDVHKTLVESEDQARELGFVSSPTILVDGRDVAGELRESACGPCADACGDGCDCRVWVYNGVEHTEAPAGLIADAILAAAYGRPQGDPVRRDEEVNENLKRFFAGKNRKAENCCERVSSCC